MKIKTTTVMKDLDGKPLKEPFGDGETRTLTLGDMCSRALLNDQAETDGKKKADMYHLAMRLHSTNKDVEITVEECVLIKEKIAAGLNVLVTGQCWDLLEKAAK